MHEYIHQLPAWPEFTWNRDPLADPLAEIRYKQGRLIGHERVHYEAPPAKRVAKEMKAFLRWFEAPSNADPVLRAAVAHFWFVTIHPFEDGNGRIARAIADMALARSEKSPQRFYSMSSQIRRERSDYYMTLERTQKGGLDVTSWQEWFLSCLHRAIEGSQETLSSVLKK